MASNARPWTTGVSIGVIVLSAGLFAARHWKQAPPAEKVPLSSGPAEQHRVAREAGIPPQRPEHAKHAHRRIGGHPKGAKDVSKPDEGETPLPPRTMVLMDDGRLVPIRGTKLKLGDPGVLAEVYEGAPPIAVRRLWNVLRSGSNEYAEFTKSEKYPEWVYDEIERMYPGQLGKLLAHLARRESGMAPERRPTVVLDYGEAGSDPYTWMILSDFGEVPVAETRYGRVSVDIRYGGMGPGDCAVFLAHRLASGDPSIHTPKIPPPGYRDWEHWARDAIEDEYQAELERLGILPKKAG